MPRCPLLALAVAACCGLTVAPGVRAQPATDAAEARDRVANDRFLAVVEKAPRRGTALDRVYGYHVERGTLDSFLKTYQDRVAANPNDGASWLILGLVESQRGRDALAVADLRKAEAARPDDPLPAYYLGQSLVLVGQPDDAAQAFERALGRKPGRADLLEIFQGLGRVYQRAHRNDQALAVWSRLEKQFPDDPRVQEQIAAALAEESQPDQALPRYEALAKKARDKFRQVQFLIDAADLKVRLNRSNDALADFEGLLGRLDPESWLHREVRRKIEEIFGRTDDQAGLTAYYERWIKKTPDDVEAMARLGRSLVGQGRMADARGWFEKAVALAPSRRDLRSALIDQLLGERKFAEAAAQYEAIARVDPNNPDVIREWGKVILRDAARPEADRKAAALAVWKRLIDARPDDPATLVQVADLYRGAGWDAEAIGLYDRAIALAPDAPQYAEYLGEFYHRLKRSPEALATWRKIAEGKRRTPKTVGRLSEILGGFGYKDEALVASKDAAGLDPADFDLQLRHADLLQAAEKLADERAQLARAAQAALGTEQVEAVLERQIRNEQASGDLGARSDALRAELEAGTDPTAERWRRLARRLEVDGKASEALVAADRGLRLEPRSVPILALIARIDEGLGNLGAAADTLRTLASIDRRARTEYLTGVARLEARLGRKDAALAAGRDLLAAAPGQVENHQFFADLCFGLGQVDEGLDALRRAVRLNESDPKAIASLAETLATQFRTEEAIEMFWRAFEKGPDLDARLATISRLTALYLQRNQFDRLVARLERQGREADRQREAGMCLAQAYSASGDFGTARAELERLLSGNPRDTKILHQLSLLAEAEGDPGLASKYQKQLVEVAPGDEATARLAQLYLAAGEVAEAEAIWTRMASGGEPESFRVLMAIDSLLAGGKREVVLGITENLLRKGPGNWEATYREGVALAGLNRPDDAARRFRAILDWKGDDDAVGSLAKARKRFGNRPGDPAAAAQPAANAYAPTKTFPLQERLGRVYLIRSATGLEYRQGTASIWSPDDFGQARMAALGWLYQLASKGGKQDAMVLDLKAARDRTSDPRAHRDLYYLQALRFEFGETFEAAATLARVDPANPSAQFALLNSLPVRAKNANSVVYQPSTKDDGIPPLPPSQIDQVLTSFRLLRARQPDWIHAAILTAIAEELRRGGRGQAIDGFYRDALASATDADSAASVLRLAAERGDVDAVIQLFDKYERLRGNKPTPTTNVLYSNYGGYYTLASLPADSIGRAMLARADAKAMPDVLRLLDHYLGELRRPERFSQRVRAVPMANAAALANGRPPRFQVWTGKLAKFTSVTYPTPNPYLDIAAIQVLRNAFELYQRDDLVSDLVAHLSKGLNDPSDPVKVYARLALAAIRWWQDDRDESLRELTEAARISRSDPDLILGLAELRAQRNEPEEALKLADSFEPLDQKAMQRREILALRLSVLTGDVGRARKGAERLFGLRLDADTQVQLAAQMHQLGMHELAEAVLGRARRRAGGNAAAMVALMLQYQSQGKPEIAVQVAHQVLRRHPNRSAALAASDPVDARGEALGVLARSGRIREMIARVEAQLARSPGASQLHQSLADYYKAAGDKDKYKAEIEALIKAKPDDGKLRFQVGTELAASGDNAAAVDHYKAAIQLEPNLFGSDYYTIEQAFRQADRSEELIELLEAADLRTLGQYYYVTQAIAAVLRDKATRDRGFKLFRKAWDAFPTSHEYMMSYIADEDFLNAPEMYEYVHDAVLPRPAQVAVAPWAGVEEISKYLPDGRVGSMGGLLLDLAGRGGRLEALGAEVRAIEGRLPAWKGGRVVRGLALARGGRAEDARAMLAPLFDPQGADSAPGAVRWIVGSELDAAPELRPLALEIQRGAVEDEELASIGYSSHPACRLVSLYRRAGRPADARRELLRYVRSKRSGVYTPQILAYYKIMDSPELGARLRELGYPADAARLCDEILGDREAFELAGTYITGEGWPELIRAELARDLDALTPAALIATWKAQVADAVAAPPEARGFDPTLLVYPREFDRGVVVSLLAEAIRAEAADPAGRAGLIGTLDALAASRPRDPSVALARGLAALAARPAAEASAIVEALARQVESTPLEPLAPGERANARQRREAAAQLGFWVLAREVARVAGGAEPARILAARAMEAASRQAETGWSEAMHLEAGRDALARGDRAAAEASWGRMLDLALGKLEGSKPGAIPVATLDRFERAATLARLAAREGLFGLAIRALVEPLRGGPPVVPLQVGVTARAVAAGTPAATAKDREIARTVGLRLAEEAARWERGGVAPAAIYEALRDVALPPGRPLEVFLYARPVDLDGPDGPAAVSTALVRWAIRADRVADLRDRLEARSAEPMARPGVLAILAQLDLARGDAAGSNRRVEALAALMAADKLRSTAELGCLVALPALDRPDTRAAAAALLARAAETLQAAGAEGEAGRVRLALARDRFALGKAEEGRAALRADLEARNQAAATDQGRARRTLGVAARAENERQAAAESARLGQWDDAMEALGRSVDARPAGARSGAGPGFAGVAVARHLLGLPARDRYARLKAWTLPTEGRPGVRLLVAFAPPGVPPEAFGRFRSFDPARGVISYPDLLIDAARDAGTLDDLAAALGPAVAKKAENAEALAVILALARGRTAEAEPSLQALLIEWSKKTEAPRAGGQVASPTPSARPLADALQVRAALGDPTLAELAGRLGAKLLPRLADRTLADHLRLDLAAVLVAQAGSKGIEAGADPGLAWWSPDPSRVARTRAQGAIPPWWVAEGGTIAHRVGPTGLATTGYDDGGDRAGATPDSLVAAFPLTGRFELAVDVVGTGVAVGYGGTLVDPIRGVRAGIPLLAPLGRYNTAAPIRGGRPTNVALPFASTTGPNRVAIRVEPGAVRYVVNGHLAFEDLDPGPAAPFVVLGASAAGSVAFREITLSGSPEIPREVRIGDGPYLDGWRADTYAETRPVRPDRPARSGWQAADARPSAETDWSTRGGEIVGRRAPVASRFGASESRLAYHRPLRPGDSVAFDYFFEPDAAAVAPALGPLAFLLEPAGVRLHWLTDGPEVDPSGLGPDNAADDPSGRRGPALLPLKSGDWNRVTLALIGRTVAVEVNGVKVFERDVEAGADRIFSFCHDKDRTVARIRDVVLRGDWPASVPAAFGSAVDASTPADRKARRALIGDRTLGLDAPRILREARALPAPAAFDLLAAWTLPGDDRAGFRLVGAFEVADPPQLESIPAGLRRRVRVGGTTDAPALALIRAAKASGRLDELAKRIEAAPATTDIDRRGRFALLAATLAAQGSIDRAKSALGSLRELFEKLDPSTPEADRWPELVALASTGGVPGLEASTRPLADRLTREPAEDAPKVVGPAFRLHALRLAGEPGRQQDPVAEFAGRAWAGADGSTRRSRGQGDPPPLWEPRDGALAHVAGHEGDFVTLRTPIRGDFVAEGRSTGRDPIQFAYAGVAVELGLDGKDVVVTGPDGKAVKASLDPPLPPNEGVRTVRLAVASGTLAFSVDGRTVHERGISPQADPWLSLHQSAGSSGTIRAVRIEGKPTVLDRVELSSRADLDGWVVDPDEATDSAEAAPWDKRGDEIVGRLDADRPGSKVESLLRLRRPLLEDGEVAFEFFHDPADALAVHPAFGRLALIVEAGGVRLHRLADGQYDRSRPAPDPAADAEARRRGAVALKVGDWNRAILEVRGDALSLRINGALAFEGPIEPTNDRTFGFFHLADESAARVRNVVQRGDWPRALPSDLGFDR